jgi:hypothetical protein
MKNRKLISAMILLSLFSGGCHAQDPADAPINRKPYAAGKFFAGDKAGLEADMKQLFAKAIEKEYDNVQAIIVPHAGYAYSGIVAASGYNQIDAENEYENVFVIASSHTAHYKGASIYNIGNYETPLGEVLVNRGLANKLISASELFSFQEKAHISEHSLEVQLPFLQFHLKKDFKIIPIVIGTQDPSVCSGIAEALRPYFNDKNLFVISTDFSHYPEYDDACEVDKKTAEAVITNAPDVFMEVLKRNESSGIGNLATAMCGWSSVLTLLNLTEADPSYNYELLQYMNSGDADYYPDKSRVVGYYSIVVSQDGSDQKDESGFTLSEKDKADLLGIARLTMEQYILTGKIPEYNAHDFSEVLNTPCGAFVTLNKEDQLRGCIGRFDATEPLYQVVQQMAVASSTNDYRFPKVSKEEFEDIEIEISVLTPMKKISSVEEIELGKHGIYISKGSSSGTFLPQVATETGWDLETFLGHCSRDKARIGWDGWKTADIYIYEALVFHE